MTSPKNHHYLPQFYLSEWTYTDQNELAVFEQISHTGKLHVRNRSPKETGSQNYLYSIKDVTGKNVPAFETDFYSPLDNAAAIAHQILVGKKLDRSIFKQRDWCRFLTSLLYRNPSDIRRIRKAFQEPEKNFDTNGPDFGFVSSFKNAENTHTYATQYAIAAQIEQSPFLKIFQSMPFGIISLPNTTDGHFLTSDCPLIMPNRLNSEEAVLMVPLSPQKLYVASHYSQYIDCLGSLPEGKLTETVNVCVVKSAQNYVYSQNQSTYRDLIETHLHSSQNEEKTTIEIYAERMLQKI